MIGIQDSLLMIREDQKFLILKSNYTERSNFKLKRIFLSDGSFLSIRKDSDCYLINNDSYITELEIGDEINFPRFKRKKKIKLTREDLTKSLPTNYQIKDWKINKAKCSIPDEIFLSERFGRFLGLLVFGKFNIYLRKTKTLRFFSFEPTIKFSLNVQLFRFWHQIEIAHLLGNIFDYKVSGRYEIRNKLIIWLLILLGFETEKSIIPPNLINYNDAFLKGLFKGINEINSPLYSYSFAMNLFFILNAVGLPCRLLRESSDLFGNYTLIPTKNNSTRTVVHIEEVIENTPLNVVKRCLLNSGLMLIDPKEE